MFRNGLLAALSLAALGLPAMAQSPFQSTSLGDIDPWGVGSLSRNDGALPNTLWSGSDSDTLKPLFARTNMRTISPAMRELVARALLSSARRPAGEETDQLLVRRLELIRDLGNSDVYLDFVRQADQVEGVPSVFELRIDRQFAEGNLASACSGVQASSQVSVYLLNARAVCFAVQGNMSSAELALEFAREQGSEDLWLISTIGIVGVEKPKTKPAAKFDSGLALALSIAAGLDIPDSGFAGIHPALAAALAERSDISRKLRIQAADAAALAGAISVEDYRRAYRTEPVEMPPPVTNDAGELVTPELADADNPNLPVNLLDAALQAAGNTSMTDEDRASAYQKALFSARVDLDRFSATALALLPELRRIRSPEIMMQYGEIFASAAQVAGESGLASRFLNGSVVEGGPEPDAFAIAWLAGVRIISGEDPSPESAIAVSTRLAEAAKGTERVRALRMLYMFLTFEKPVSLDARKFMSAATEETLTSGRTLPRSEMLMAQATLESGSLGEGALRTAALVGRDPSSLNLFDLALLVSALERADLDRSARALALEGIRFQRPRD